MAQRVAKRGFMPQDEFTWLRFEVDLSTAFDCPLCVTMGIQSHSIEVSSGTLLLIWDSGSGLMLEG